MPFVNRSASYTIYPYAHAELRRDMDEMIDHVLGHPDNLFLLLARLERQHSLLSSKLQKSFGKAHANWEIVFEANDMAHTYRIILGAEPEIRRRMTEPGFTTQPAWNGDALHQFTFDLRRAMNTANTRLGNQALSTMGIAGERVWERIRKNPECSTGHVMYKIAAMFRLSSSPTRPQKAPVIPLYSKRHPAPK